MLDMDISEDINHEYDKFINPILADKSVWSVANKFREARLKLYATLSREGYSSEYVSNVAAELIKRWSHLYDEYLDNIVVEDGDEEVDIDEWLQEATK